MRERLPIAADMATVVVAVLVAVLVTDRYFDQQTSPMNNPLATMLLNTQINGTQLGLDFAAVERTAIVFVQQQCPGCAESLPFYRRLVSHDTDEVQILFAAPNHEVEIEAYLESNSIVADGVVLFGPGQLPATATPTVMVVDKGGVVTHAWVGWLSADAEAEVLDELFES